MTSETSSSLFEIRPTRLGFLGAFATQPIKRGTLVLADSPLFTLDAPLQHWLFERAQSGQSGGPTPVEGEEEEEPAKDLEEFLDRAIRGFLRWKTEDERERFWELANSREDSPKAYGIFATNAVQTHGEVGGMFLLLSRFNSSCRPTLTRPAWDSQSRTTRLYALRDVHPGEELTWTYLNVLFEFEGVDARKDEMKRVFDFECGCNACDGVGMSEEDRRLSEKRLLKLRQLKERIHGSGSYDDGIKDRELSEGRKRTLETMARLAEEEGLFETSQRLKDVVHEYD